MAALAVGGGLLVSGCSGGHPTARTSATPTATVAPVVARIPALDRVVPGLLSKSGLGRWRVDPLNTTKDDGCGGPGGPTGSLIRSEECTFTPAAGGERFVEVDVELMVDDADGIAQVDDYPEFFTDRTPVAGIGEKAVVATARPSEKVVGGGEVAPQGRLLIFAYRRALVTIIESLGTAPKDEDARARALGLALIKVLPLGPQPPT